MNKKTLKLTLAAVFVVSAFGAMALRVAWATPPKGVTNTLLAGPVTVDDIDIVSQTPAHGAPPEHKRLALGRIIRLYDAWEKKDKAEEWRKKRPGLNASDKVQSETAP